MKTTVVIVCSDITQFGGIERTVCVLANALVKSGNYNIVIVSLNSYEGVPIFELLPYVNLIHLGVTNSKNLLSRCLSYPKIIKWIDEICVGNNADVIMGTDTRLNIMLSRLKKTFAVKIACEHNVYGHVTFYTSLIRKMVYPRLNAVVLLTEKDAADYAFCKNARVIPNALPFVPKHVSGLKNNVVISVGRLHKVKGFDLLIDAVDLIKDKCGGWEFRIYGDGSERENLIKRIAEKGLSKIVRVMPPLRNIEDVYLASSVYVLPSRKESFGLALLEAKSCGLPTVAFDCPHGPSEIVRDGVDGILVENGNADAMALAVLTMIENPRLRKTFGREAIRGINRFLPEKIVDRWEKLFEELKAEAEK